MRDARMVDVEREQRVGPDAGGDDRRVGNREVQALRQKGQVPPKSLVDGLLDAEMIRKRFRNRLVSGRPGSVLEGPRHGDLRGDRRTAASPDPQEGQKRAGTASLS